MSNIFNSIIQTSNGRFALFLGVAVIIIGGVAWYANFDGKYVPNGIVEVETIHVEAADSPGNITQITRNGDTLTLSIYLNDKIIVRAAKENILYVDFQPNGARQADTQVIDPNVQWDSVGANINIQSDPIVIQTSKMIARINKAPFKVSVYDSTDNFLIKESDSGGLYNRKLKFEHSSNDHFYGINGYNVFSKSPDHPSHKVNEGIIRDGDYDNNDDSDNNKESRYGVYTGHGNGAVPFIWSSKGYGLLIDTEGGEFLVNNTNDNNSIEVSGLGSKPNIDYYIISGGPTELLGAVAKISGKPPLFPKWGLGFNNTEWGIDQGELTQIVDNYRAKNIPIDSYVLDFDWMAWGEDNYGEWRWNPSKFPDGSSGNLKSKMDNKGVKLGGIRKPRVHLETEQGIDITNNDCWQPGYGPEIDYFSNKLVQAFNFDKAFCQTWFWEKLTDSFDKGVIGFWNDEADAPNLRNFNMQKGAYEWQRSYTNKRVFSFNRTFLLGAQRYAYSMWSGDIQATFSSMADERQRMLSEINLGQTHWAMDTGGFHGDPNPENYSRWMQFNTFVPISRVHGELNKQRQPWVFGSQAEKVATDAIKLRYKLIPYMYSYERRNYEAGIGLVKSLVMDYPNDLNVANYYDAWMFGDYLLVSPVVEEGQTSKAIYLPQGEWIDYFKGTVYNGGQTINYSINSRTWEDIPLFFKKGAIIPTQEVLNYIGEKPITTVEVDVFPNTTLTMFKYYDDDGETYDYENGEYFIQNMTVQDKGNEVNFIINNKEGSFTPALQYYILKMHNAVAGSITSNGTLLIQYPDLNSLKNASNEGWTRGRDIYGDVVYVKIKAQELKNIVVDKSILPQQYTLTVSKSGASKGTITATGINCGTDCSEPYDQGTSVTLTATPDNDNSTFSNWLGDCSGTSATCALTMNSDKTVTAVFDIKVIPPTSVCSTGSVQACIDSIIPSPVKQGQTLTFTGSGKASDPSKTIAKYRWRLDSVTGKTRLCKAEESVVCQVDTTAISPGVHTVYFRVGASRFGKKILTQWSNWIGRQFTVD